jgi:PEP-CTERM motif-containing protein
MIRRLAVVLTIVLGIGLCARESLATAVTDPAGDFIGTYTGPQNGDVDVLSADVVFNPTANTFTFSATFNAPVNTTANSLYVWGLNRGAGAQLLLGGSPPVGAGVIFDSVFIEAPGAGLGIVNLLDGSAATNLPGILTISGNSIVATVSASLFPSMGFTIPNYQWNLWPRVGQTSNADISDFAPDASVSLVTVAPEPASLALVGAGIVALLALRRPRAA